MDEASERITAFFEEYERNTRASDVAAIGRQYGDTFMFAGPSGAQAVSRADFLAALPRRTGFFESLGMEPSTIRSLEATPLDADYTMAKVLWRMRFAPEHGRPVVVDTSATYILRDERGVLRIVFQLDYQDLVQVAREHGLLAAR
jgi:ketosteroid isomerase-like protein